MGEKGHLNKCKYGISFVLPLRVIVLFIESFFNLSAIKWAVLIKVRMRKRKREKASH